MVDTLGNGFPSMLSQTSSTSPPPKLTGVHAVQKLNLTPAEIPLGLSGFGHEDMPHIRICSKMNHHKKLQERVLIMAKYCFLMTDLKGKVKRFLRFGDVVSVRIQRTPTGEYYEMHVVASQSSCEHDLLLHLVHDNRNRCGSDQKSIEEFAQLYELVASTFLGKPTTIEWHDGSSTFIRDAQLGKNKHWKTPHNRCSEAKRRSQSPRRSSVPYNSQTSSPGGFSSVKSEPMANTFQPASPLLFNNSPAVSHESSPRAATNPSPDADMSPNEVASFSSPKEISTPPESEESSKKSKQKEDDELDLDDGWGPIGGFSPNASLPILDLLNSQEKVAEANAPGSFKSWANGNASSPTLGSFASFNSSSPTFLQPSKRPNFSEGL